MGYSTVMYKGIKIEYTKGSATIAMLPFAPFINLQKAKDFIDTLHK